MENTYTENEQVVSVNEQPVYTPPVQNPANNPAGTGSFFGLMLLFSIPIVGFIASIVTIFAAKNKSIKNFAKATLIWQIISLAVFALVVAGIVMLVNTIEQMVTELVGSQFGNLGELGELGDLSELIGMLQSGEIDPNQFGNIGDISSNVIGDVNGSIGDIIDQLPTDEILATIG